MPPAVTRGTLPTIRRAFQVGTPRKAPLADYESDPVQDHGDGEAGENTDLAFVLAVAKGALWGLPLMVVFMCAAVWLITDESVGTSIATGLLPGVLLGVFGGGFIGVLGAMKH